MGALGIIGAAGAALLGYALLGRRSAEASAGRAQDRGAAGSSAIADPSAASDADATDDDARPGREAVRDPEPAPGLPAPGAAVAPPLMSDWAKILAPGCASGHIQLSYALRWMELESGGNPCEVGYPAARGPDGLPLEIGIAQLYNPDDFNLLSPNLSGSELRAYCVPGDQHETLFRGKIVRGFSRAMSRPMLPGEMLRQAEAAIALILRCMNQATRDLARVGAGPSWSPSRRDYWALVKLQHGLPALSRQGLPAVTKLLGRPPGSWSEFTAVLARVRLAPRIEKKYREDFPRILENAQRCASVIEPRAEV